MCFRWIQFIVGKYELFLIATNTSYQQHCDIAKIFKIYSAALIISYTNL